jgi:hypothetical protein
MKTLSILLCLAYCIGACGQTNNNQQGNIPSVSETASNEAPTCDCCLFDEANRTPGHQIKIAADTAKGQRVIIRGIVYQSDGKTPASDV